jgi:hypothetical protein
VAALHFNGRPADTAAAVGKLHETHCRIVGRWHRFERWFNPQPIEKLLACGYGFLATGPEPLILGYQEVLTAMHIPSSILSNAPKHWNGQRWEEETGSKMVLILGKTYVVAEHVESNKTAHD